MSATDTKTVRPRRTKKTKAAAAHSAMPVEPPSAPTPSWQSVRRKKVERARKLMKNPNYPGPAVTGAVARLLARNLQKLDDPNASIGI